MTWFSDLSLSRRLELAEGSAGAAFAEARALHDPASGACWTSIAGAFVIFDRPDSPITQTFGLGFDPLTAADLDSIEDFFFSRGAPADHEISPLVRKETWDLLPARGYRPIEFSSILYLPLAGREPAAPPAEITVRVAPPEELPRWAAVAAEGWSDLGDISELMRVLAAGKSVVPFIAELDGSPIATASLNIQNDVALLAGGATIPSARNRGAQRALLQARLAHARALRCDIAMMGAEPGSASQRNAEREGFRIAYSRTKWRRKRL